MLKNVFSSSSITKGGGTSDMENSIIFFNETFSKCLHCLLKCKWKLHEHFFLRSALNEEYRVDNLLGSLSPHNHTMYIMVLFLGVNK